MDVLISEVRELKDEAVNVVQELRMVTDHLVNLLTSVGQSSGFFPAPSAPSEG